MPHKLTRLYGRGIIYIMNIPLSYFLSLPVPEAMRRDILKGEVLFADDSFPVDLGNFKSWVMEYHNQDPVLQGIVQDDIGLNLRRLGHRGWQLASSNDSSIERRASAGSRALYHASNMVDFINKNYTSNLTLDQIAEQAGLQRNYAINVFTKVMGVPIKQYILRTRLQAAQYKLLKTEEKVSSIAFECGFGSLSRFYDVFNRHFGLSPQKFRQQLSGS